VRTCIAKCAGGVQTARQERVKKKMRLAGVAAPPHTYAHTHTHTLLLHGGSRTFFILAYVKVMWEYNGMEEGCRRRYSTQV